MGGLRWRTESPPMRRRAHQLGIGEQLYKAYTHNIYMSAHTHTQDTLTLYYQFAIFKRDVIAGLSPESNAKP